MAQILCALRGGEGRGARWVGETRCRLRLARHHRPSTLSLRQTLLLVMHDHVRELSSFGLPPPVETRHDSPSSSHPGADTLQTSPPLHHTLSLDLQVVEISNLGPLEGHEWGYCGERPACTALACMNPPRAIRSSLPHAVEPWERGTCEAGCARLSWRSSLVLACLQVPLTVTTEAAS